jgi:large repetitive protein
MSRLIAIFRQGAILALLVGAAASQVGAQTVSSAANQTFLVGAASTTISPITITDAATPTITAKKDIRVHIPATFNMSWDQTITTATITGGAAGKVATAVTYDDARTLKLNVSTNFVAGDQIVVSGLKFTGFTATSATSNLWIEVENDGAVSATDDKTITIAGATLTGAADQVFTVGDPATAMTSVTVTDASTATITAANDIRLRISATFNMVWNTSVTTATIGGGAAGKVSTTVSYEDAGKTLVVNVTTNFAASDQITVSGLQFTSFSAASAADRLQLVTSGAGGSTVATSDRTKTIYGPMSISSGANQGWNVGSAATTMSTLTISEDATPSITAAADVRVRIPAGFPATWNTSGTTATLGGTAASKVSATVSYEDAGRTLVLNVTSNFAVGDQLTVAGLQFANFTATAAATNLQMVIAGSGGATAATDDKTISIIDRYGISSGANQTFLVGDPVTTLSPITVTDNGTTPTITAKQDIRIFIPTGFNMSWDNTVTSVTVTGGAAAKVAGTVTYAAGGAAAVINVTTDFAAADQVIISGLKVKTFTAPSAVDNFDLKVAGDGGPVASSDDKTIEIVAPVLFQISDQAFTVGDAATATSNMTVTENSSLGSIKAAKDLRFRIPSTFNMVWNTGITTITVSGSAASKVSTTVTYEDAGKTLVVDVTSNFSLSDVLTVSGPQYQSFTAASTADRLQLVTAGAGGATIATSDKTVTIYAALNLTSAANQSFLVNAGATNMSQITVREDAQPSITATGDIRIRIPATLNMEWDQTLTTATLGSGAAGKVSTAVTYEDAGKTLVLNVTSNFVAGDVLTISGLKFKNFTASSPPDYLQLVIAGAGGATVATDVMTKTVVGATISSGANQLFHVGDAATTISPITITDAATATITAKKDLRVHIPAAFNMAWDQTITTATITGGAAANVATAVTYDDARTLKLDVTTNFAGGDQIIVSGLKFTSFTAASAVSRLYLETKNDGVTTAVDDKTIQVVVTAYGALLSPDTTRVSRLPSNGTTRTVDLTLTNSGNVSDSYDLLTTKSPGTAVTVVSISGTGVTQGALPDSARRATLTAGAASTVTVTYSVANVASGTTDTLFLKARSVGNTSQSYTARMELTVTRPVISVTKEVSPNGTQVIGTDLTYTATVVNVGTASAATLALIDSVPSALQYKLSSASTTLPAGVTVLVEYSNNAGSTWTYVPADQACGAPAGFDRCVNRIRWTFTGSLSSTTPDNVALLEFISRLR